MVNDHYPYWMAISLGIYPTFSDTPTWPRVKMYHSGFILNPACLAPRHTVDMAIQLQAPGHPSNGFPNSYMVYLIENASINWWFNSWILGVHPNFQEPPIYDNTNSLYLHSIPSQSGEISQDSPTFMPTGRSRRTNWAAVASQWQRMATWIHGDAGILVISFFKMLDELEHIGTIKNEFIVSLLNEYVC